MKVEMDNNFFNKKIAVIIPCYNESEAIGQVVLDINLLKKNTAFDITVIVVNDCSTDHSLEIIRKLDCVSLDLPINLGIGGTVQTGVRFALQRGFDLAIQMDGDGQHPAPELPKLLSGFDDGNTDVVIGSRYLTKEGFQSSFLRRLGIGYFTKLIALIFNKKITDPTSGFRAFNTKAMKIIARDYPNEYPEPEILAHFFYHKLVVKEVPVVMIGRQGGVSSIDTSESVYFMLKVSLGVIFSHIRLLIHGDRKYR